jgi:hypothetical protein
VPGIHPVSASVALEEDAVVAETSNNKDGLFYVLAGLAAAWGIAWIVGLLVITK